MRERKISRRRGLLFKRLVENDPHVVASAALVDLFETAARDWPLGKKMSFWERAFHEPLVDVGKAEEWFEKWFGSLKR